MAERPDYPICQPLPDLTGGYDDNDFVDSPPESLKCPVCLLVLREPHLLSCCGSHLCQVCIQRIRASEQPCPYCRSEEYINVLNKEKRRKVFELKVHCENSGNGCDWVGELGDLQRHLTNKCPYVEAVCRHGCGRKYPRCVLLVHEKDECPSRPFEMKMATFTQQIMEKLTALETNYEKKLREQEERHEAEKKELQVDLMKLHRRIEKIEERFKETQRKELLLAIYIKRCVWRLFHSYSLEKKWTDVVSQMRENGVTIVSSSKPSSQKPFVKIKGEPDKLEAAKEKILELQASVKEHKLPIACPGVCRYFFNDPNGQIVLRGVENDAGVCIEMGVKDDKLGVDDLSSNSQFTRLCFGNTNEMKTVSVYVGDITQFNKAEVIVNAANEDLQHSAGVAQVIADKGGPVITRDSEEYISRRGKVSTGSAVLFPRVGNLPLPYKAIVHTVGPRWIGKNEREIALLKRAIYSSLKQARDYNSIAIPAISSGIFGFPVDICADALLQAVVKFSENDPGATLNEINFVVTQDNADVFLKTAKKYIKNVHSFNETPVTPVSTIGGDQTQQGHRRRRLSKPTANSVLIPRKDQVQQRSFHRRYFGYGNEEQGEEGSDEDKEGQDDDWEDSRDESAKRMLANLSLESEVILHIYGQTDQSVKRAEKKLRAIIDTQFVNDEVDNPSITSLSDETVDELETFAKSHQVDIDIERDPVLPFVKLHGCQGDVLRVKDKLRDAIIASEKGKPKTFMQRGLYRNF